MAKMGKGARIKGTRKMNKDLVKKELTNGNAFIPFAKPHGMASEKMAAMQDEINWQLKQAHQKFFQTEIAVILWVLHSAYGWGPVRLRRFMASYKDIAKQLTDYYEEDYENQDAIWLYARKLKEETGIDVYVKDLEDM